ncbi:MAG TPA: hypothetical protein VFN10_06950 [Thermoanaerobaculia bacterium]|nr:hypothetical protein [Thermoanaerobaculia bacterium]
MKSLGIVLFTIAVSLSGAAAHATCTANVSASVSGTTLSVNASGGGTCGGSSISVTVDGVTVCQRVLHHPTAVDGLSYRWNSHGRRNRRLRPNKRQLVRYE